MSRSAQPPLHILYHQFNYLYDVLLAQRVENDGLIDSVQELRPERPASGPFQPSLEPPSSPSCRFPPSGPEPERLASQSLRAEVARHYNDGVSEINGAALSVGKPSVLQDLQQYIKYVRMRLFDFVE